MALELGHIPIEEVAWGKQTCIQGKTLLIDREALVREARGNDLRILSVETEIARPGDSIRIVPVKDVIEPRVKVAGSGGVFPGFISGVETVGSGRTHVLQGCSVITAGQIIGYQEGLIDMSGPNARYSSFSRLQNIVLVIKVAEHISRYDHEEALRLSGLRAAAYLGNTGRAAHPTEVVGYGDPGDFQAVSKNAHLPRVAYVYMLLSQGLLHDSYLYGRDVKTLLPTFIMPTEVMDGAIVSGNCVSACDKNTTFHHQNNPIIEELYQRDGIDLSFAGVVVTNANVTLTDKELSADYTVKLLELLGVDGVIISKEGFGNPDADAMMICAGLAEKGMPTVLITDEFAGVDGDSQSLADVTPLADAIVSVGNANERISLTPMDRVIGDQTVMEKIAGASGRGSSDPGGCVAELQVIMGATNELGFERLSAKEI